MRSLCLHEFEVKGILDGTITEIWRPCKIQPPGEGYQISRLVDSTAKENRRNIDKLHWIKLSELDITDSNDRYFESPFGPFGTRIVGKETWCPMCNKADPYCYCETEEEKKANHYIEYRADTGNKYPGDWDEDSVREEFDESYVPRWRSPIHMPREASRITLINVGVDIKRVREITEEEAKAAGVTGREYTDYWPVNAIGLPSKYLQEFLRRWDQHYYKKGYPWGTAWAWKLKFEAEVKR